MSEPYNQESTDDWQRLIDRIPRSSTTGRIEPLGPRPGDIRTNPPRGEAYRWDGRRWTKLPPLAARRYLSGL
jgi:hypothetical protein